MRLLNRLVAVVATISVAGTVWFVAAFAAAGGLLGLLTVRLLGSLTLVGWLITLVAGPIAAIQLWRLRESGRRAGLALFGYGAAYYLIGLVALRAPEASVWPILAGACWNALPLILLLLPRVSEVLVSPNSARAPRVHAE
jgi:hypothetical protein